MCACVMAAVWMCALWIAAAFTCRLPTEPFCRCPEPMELSISFVPLIDPDASCRAEMVVPSSVSAAVPSVTLVYLRVRQS